jgi:hypothetical protein
MIENDTGFFPIPNRRLSPRYTHAEVPFLKSVTFTEGSDVQVINISRGGMLLETQVRLCPRSTILMELTTSEGIFKTHGDVLRCAIVALKEAPQYQAAVSFENPFRLMDSLANTLAESGQNTKSEDSNNQRPNNPQSFQTAPNSDADQDITTLRFAANNLEDVFSMV